MRLNHDLRDKLRSSLLALSLGLFGLCVTGTYSPAAAADAPGKPTDPQTEKPPPEPKTVKLSLKDLQAECDRIDKDIKKYLGNLAALEVECERLESKLTALKEQRTKLGEEIAGMLKAVETKAEKVTYNGRTYGLSDLAQRLDAKVDDYKSSGASIKTREQLVASKSASLELAQERIRDLRDQKDELRVTIAKLEALIEAGRVKPDAAVEVDAAPFRKSKDLADKLARQFTAEEKNTEPLKRPDPDPKKAPDRHEKSIDEVIQAAKKALRPDEKKDKPADK
jgi:chromosome segregation ATPase